MLDCTMLGLSSSLTVDLLNYLHIIPIYIRYYLTYSFCVCSANLATDRPDKKHKEKRQNKDNRGFGFVCLVFLFICFSAVNTIIFLTSLILVWYN